MVARSNNETDKEIITEVYQIHKNTELRSNNFGVWDEKRGLKGPAQSLYGRRNNLFGQTLRVASLHVRLLILFFTKCSNYNNK